MLHARATTDAAGPVGDNDRLSSRGSEFKVDNGDRDAEFGGTEARKRLEKKFLLKLDARMSILILIYILNYVSVL